MLWWQHTLHVNAMVLHCLPLASCWQTRCNFGYQHEHDLAEAFPARLPLASAQPAVQGPDCGSIRAQRGRRRRLTAAGLTAARFRVQVRMQCALMVERMQFVVGCWLEEGGSVR